MKQRIADVVNSSESVLIIISFYGQFCSHARNYL